VAVNGVVEELALRYETLLCSLCQLVMVSLFATVLAGIARTCRWRFWLLVVHNYIWIYVGTTDYVCRNMVYSTKAMMRHQGLLARLLGSILTQLLRAELVGAAFVESGILGVNRGACHLLLGYVIMSVAVSSSLRPVLFLLVWNSWLKGMQRFFTVLVRRQTTIYLLLWGVVRITWQRLDQLIVLLDLLLIVLHLLQLQIDLARCILRFCALMCTLVAWARELLDLLACQELRICRMVHDGTLKVRVRQHAILLSIALINSSSFFNTFL